MIGYARACIVIWYGVVKLRLTMVLLGNRDNYLLLAICLPDVGGGGGHTADYIDLERSFAQFIK